MTIEPSGPRTKRLTTILAASLAAMTAIALFLGVALYKQTGDRRSMEQAKVAAERSASDVTTYSYRTIDRDVQRVLRGATGDFRKQYQQALGGDKFRTTLLSEKGEARGEVKSAVVTSLDHEVAEVVVTIDQTATTEKQTAPRTITRRLLLLMVETTTGWKVDKVSFL